MHSILVIKSRLQVCLFLPSFHDKTLPQMSSLPHSVKAQLTTGQKFWWQELEAVGLTVSLLSQEGKGNKGWCLASFLILCNTGPRPWHGVAHL